MNTGMVKEDITDFKYHELNDQGSLVIKKLYFDPHIVDIFLQVLNDARVLLP